MLQRLGLLAAVTCYAIGWYVLIPPIAGTRARPWSSSLVAEYALDKEALKSVIVKNGQLVGAMARLRVARADAEHLRTTFSMSERHACGLAGIAVSSFRYATRRPAKDAGLSERLKELAQQHPRYGYPRMRVLVRRGGLAANHKRVHRLYREASLILRRKKRRRLMRLKCVFPRAAASNEEWTLDLRYRLIGQPAASADLERGGRIHARVLGSGNGYVARQRASDPHAGAGHRGARRGAAAHPHRQRAGVHQPLLYCLVPRPADRAGAYPAGQAGGKRARGELSRALARGMLPGELVPQPVRRVAADRNLARSLQRGSPARQPRISDTNGVRGASRCRSIQCCCGAKDLKHRPLAPHPAHTGDQILESCRMLE